MTNNNVLIIAGPTASGKSAFAMEKATACDGTIINADSLQIYNCLPQLTAMPTIYDMAQVPHMLYGVLQPNDVVTALSWAKMAVAAIHETLGAGRTPILVGGTGFYIKTLTEGLSPIPEISPATRVVVTDLMDKIGIGEFFKQLQEIDPIICEKIDRNNPQRLLRAMEVYVGTGKPLSYWQSVPPVPVDKNLKFTTTIIIPEREILYKRCNDRLDKMIEDGVIDEVAAFDERILNGEINPESPCMNALGFHAFQQYIRGDIDLESATFLAKNETRNYAKRQTTWFRNQSRDYYSSSK